MRECGQSFRDKYVLKKHVSTQSIRQGKVPFVFIFISVVDPDPVLFLPLDPGSGMCFSRISDPGSQDHILKSFLTIFLVKSSIIL